MPRITRRQRNHRKRYPAAVIRKRNRRRKRSSLEKKVYQWLEEDKIPFHKEKPIGRCHVDIFLEPRTVIELNGCYWHGCMICNRELSAKHKLVQSKDARRYGFFRNKGYDVIVFWECEVEKEPARVRKMLRLLAGKI